MALVCRRHAFVFLLLGYRPSGRGCCFGGCGCRPLRFTPALHQISGLWSCCLSLSSCKGRAISHAESGFDGGRSSGRYHAFELELTCLLHKSAKNEIRGWVQWHWGLEVSNFLLGKFSKNEERGWVQWHWGLEVGEFLLGNFLLISQF